MTLTLMQCIVIVAAAPMMAAAQVPPKPASPPPQAPQPAQPTPAAKPVPIRSDLAIEFEMLSPRIDEVRWATEEMRFLAAELAHVDMLDMRAKVEAMTLFDMPDMQAKFDAMSMIDMPAVKAEAAASARASAMAAAEVATMQFDIGPFDFKFAPGSGDKLLNAQPRAPWAREDPADSLYRVAREALNRGEYRRAAQVFAEVTRKFPTSRYAHHSAYWEAFARYRIGTTDELRLALRILEGKGEGVSLQARELAQSGRDGSVDIPGLRTRVLGALAARGDRAAEEALKAEATQNRQSCDREEVSVQAEALNALAQMDITSAMPTVKKVLGRRDECSVELRRRALYIVGRQPPADASAIILDVAKNDPNNGIRGEAIRWLPRIAGDAAVPTLQELLRTSSEEDTQRHAITALGAIDSDVARRAVRTIIERTDVAERVRIDAILSVSREREGRSPSADDLSYLRGLYAKMSTTKLKEAVLTAVSRVPSTENQQFLFGVARNLNEPAQLRAAALQRLGRMESVTAADIAKLYDVADSRSMREQILSALSQRKEPEAIDKMIEVARLDTDPRIRSYAVSLLGRSNNERAKQYIQSLLDK